MTSVGGRGAAPAPAGPAPRDGNRLLLISPVRNEADHLEQVVRAVAAQRRPPDAWIIVDDGSTDGTAERLEELTAGLPFVTVARTPRGYTRDAGDRNAAGGPDRAWNYGLSLVDRRAFTHLGKLDGDIVLPPEYLEGMLERFRAEPGLGMAGGTVTEWRENRWWTMPTPPEHVTAPARIYSLACFEAIGGMPPYMGADMITTIYAQMRGYRTRTLADLPVRHLRPMATAAGVRRGRKRQGAYQYVVHYPLAWILLRSLVVAGRFRPYGLSGLWYLEGYLGAARRRVPRVEDPEWRDFARAEQRARFRAGVRRAIRRRGDGQPAGREDRLLGALRRIERHGAASEWIGPDPYEGLNATRLVGPLQRTPLGRRVLHPGGETLAARPAAGAGYRTDAELRDRGLGAQRVRDRRARRLARGGGATGRARCRATAGAPLAAVRRERLGLSVRDAVTRVLL